MFVASVAHVASEALAVSSVAHVASAAQLASEAVASGVHMAFEAVMASGKIDHQPDSQAVKLPEGNPKSTSSPLFHSTE